MLSTPRPASFHAVPCAFHLQEEMLRQVAKLSDALDYEALKAQILPAVAHLCLSTTSGEAALSTAGVCCCCC